ncbi:MAG: hypothetical protein IKU48_00460 [Clostridia bacterium]|nr:hypothetical protein [Clostridia bacterium]
MKRSGRHHFRYILLASLFVLICTFFVGRIIYLQVTAPEKANTSDLTVRTLTVKALRGEIFDRNGNPLVSNEYTYNVYLDGGSFPKTNYAINREIVSLIDILEDSVETEYFPLQKNEEIIEYKAYENDSQKEKYFLKMLDRYALSRDTEAVSLAEFLEKRYGLIDSNGNLTVGKEYYLSVMAIRYESERLNFSSLNPFTVAYDISKVQLTAIEEANLNGVCIEKKAQRVYNYPSYASHILGRTGKIPSEKLDYYTEKGYSMDAIVGIGGAEEAFEEYLRGQDGILVIVEDKQGNRVDEYYKKEPVPGKDVYLTIDIDMQITAEDALAYNIQYIRNKANEKIAQDTAKYTLPDGTISPDAKISQYIGEDVSSGAATVVNPHNGEVLAIASNPTFNLTTYVKEYNNLLNTENNPLFNRALMGTYEPGSTFKISVAAAALENGIINRNTTIFDSGVYKYYNDFQPHCWIYTSYGYGHGNVNVISAIQNSCNYFFYDVGRQLTIERLNEYCKSLGLGVLTGIEIPEATGILAGPEYRASINKVWVPGDTIQASIGQSDNNFTPMQISMYLSTLINGGTRYQAHILHSVREYGTNEIIYEPTPNVLNTVQLSEENLETIRLGMRNVMENGTAAPVFADYPIELGGKTGTAQVGKTKSNNGIFMAFAPYDEPQIVATCVIEQAGGSNDCGITLKRLFNKYFNITE